MADDRTKKLVTAVFLLALFFVISIYIGLTMLRVYMDSSRFSSEKSKSSVSCVGYVYSIDNIKYSNSLLSFDFKNSQLSDYEEMSLIVRSGNITKEIALTNLIRGLTKPVEFEISLYNNTFAIYPKSCEQDAQRYSI